MAKTVRVMGRPTDDRKVSDLVEKIQADCIYLAHGELGVGVFAKRSICAGEAILRFDGPLIDFETAVRKNERECYPLQIAPNTYVDLEAPGCYANHSCQPNAGVRNLMLIAITDIQETSEIRYDYSTTMDEDHFTMQCRCKSAGCRGVVTDFKYLPLPVQTLYLQLGIVQPFIAYRTPVNYFINMCDELISRQTESRPKTPSTSFDATCIRREKLTSGSAPVRKLQSGTGP